METRYVIYILITILLPVPAALSASPVVHPSLLFNDITEVPGYQYRIMDPWKGWEKDILSSADESLLRNFSGNLGKYDRIKYRGGFARDLGLAYQITKKKEYLIKAKEALLNMDTGAVGDSNITAAVHVDKIDKIEALDGYMLAYDWVQPALDPSSDIIIRDKLATLADTVYKDTNDNGTQTGYIDFDDILSQAYPQLGVASAVLYDYSNPNRLPLSSTPEEWHRVGTEYLFVNDRLHSYNRSAFSFGIDEVSGKYLDGAYKAYGMDDFALWFQVSTHFYGENLLEKYPVAERAFTSELWESMPNGYSSNYVTNGNTKWIYQKAILSLLPDDEKSQILNHIDRIENSKLLPYSEDTGAVRNIGDLSRGGISPAFLYCVYGDYRSIERKFPDTTSHLDAGAVYQVFRQDWDNDSDWLSLITFDPPVTRTNRDMGHHDQLSFEYYSRGDLLLADGGEPKYTLAYPAGYGKFAVFHNTIAIENPRSPYPVSPVSGSRSRGIYKGHNTELVTPSTVDAVIQAPWFEALQAHATITKLSSETADIYQTEDLSSPIRYSRTILYPGADYFIVVDRMEGSEEWVYRSIFRPTSLSITPTKDADRDGRYTATETGHVNGTVSIGATQYDWQGLAFNTETDTGMINDTIHWTVRNPYGRDVRLDLVSVPASEILITKHIGRIGGYQPTSEVYSPIISLKSPESETLYRVTALLSRYSDEEGRTAEEIPVQGNGNALFVSSPSCEDYIYAGAGNSTFGRFSTDAETAFVRVYRNGTVLATLMGGSYLGYDDGRLIDLSEKTGYITLMNDGNSTEYRISGNRTVVRGSLFPDTPVTGEDAPVTANSPEGKWFFNDVLDFLTGLKDFLKKPTAR